MNGPRFGIHFDNVSQKTHLIINIFFVVGALLCGLVTLITNNQAADQVKKLQPIETAALMSTPPGTEVLIEAHVSDENRVLYEPDGLVAYVLEGRSVWNEEDSWETGSWSELERATPPLLLELSGRVIEIENDDYELQNVTRIESGGQLGEPDSMRVRGVRAGEPVLVLGTVLGGKEVGRIEAEFIAGGTRADYISGQRSAGWIMAAASLVVALLGGIILFREPLAALWSRWRDRFRRS